MGPKPSKEAEQTTPVTSHQNGGNQNGGLPQQTPEHAVNNGVAVMTETEAEVLTEYTECEDRSEDFETASSCAPSCATQSDEDETSFRGQTGYPPSDVENAFKMEPSENSVEVNNVETLNSGHSVSEETLLLLLPDTEAAVESGDLEQHEVTDDIQQMVTDDIQQKVIENEVSLEDPPETENGLDMVDGLSQDAEQCLLNGHRLEQSDSLPESEENEVLDQIDSPEIEAPVKFTDVLESENLTKVSPKNNGRSTTDQNTIPERNDIDILDTKDKAKAIQLDEDLLGMRAIIIQHINRYKQQRSIPERKTYPWTSRTSATLKGLGEDKNTEEVTTGSHQDHGNLLEVEDMEGSEEDLSADTSTDSATREDLLEIFGDMLEDDSEKYKNIQEDILALSLLLKRNGGVSQDSSTPQIVYTAGRGRKLSSPSKHSVSLSDDLSNEFSRSCVTTEVFQGDEDPTNLSILNMLSALMAKPSQSTVAPMTLVEKSNPVAGMLCTLTFDIRDRRWYHAIMESTLTVEGRGKSMQLLFTRECQYRPHKPTSVSFRPRVPGLVIVSVRTSKKGVPESVFRVEIEGANPLLWFNEGSCWPVALYLDKENERVWVAYSDHICLFTMLGAYTEQVLQLEEGCINDLTVSPSGARYAISLSGWEEIQGVIVRFQEIRIYETSQSRVLHSISRDPIIFEVPILCVDFIDEDHVIIPDRDALCRFSIELGDLDQRCGPINDLGTVSKVKYCRERFFVVDGATSRVNVYSSVGQWQSSIKAVDEDGIPFRGLRCVDVDEEDNVVVCDSISSAICVYRLDGSLVSRVVAQWSAVMWPVGVAVAENGGVFVADHGNGCIKKYAYL